MNDMVYATGVLAGQRAETVAWECEVRRRQVERRDTLPAQPRRRPWISDLLSDFRGGEPGVSHEPPDGVGASAVVLGMLLADWH